MFPLVAGQVMPAAASQAGTCAAMCAMPASDRWVPSPVTFAGASPKSRILPVRVWVVVDPDEVDDDLVRDMTELLTSMCARLYGKRAAQNRARAAVAAAADDSLRVPRLESDQFFNAVAASATPEASDG